MPGNGRQTTLQFNHPPARVVSLVPSITESLFDLGLGDAVVGITEYCTHPAEKLAELARIGGPKNPDVEQILALHPDLVLANWEENPRQAVETLEAAGVQVLVTFPRTIRESMDLLWILAGVFQSRMAAIRIETLEIAVDWALSAGREKTPFRYFCPIWYSPPGANQAWYMAFNQFTYPHAVLDLIGGENVFADRVRRYPLEADLGLQPPQDAGERDTRYPRVTVDEIRAADPVLILLPDEPYYFNEAACQRVIAHLDGVSAVRAGRVVRVDGSLLTWHGTRLAKALQELPVLVEDALSK